MNQPLLRHPRNFHKGNRNEKIRRNFRRSTLWLPQELSFHARRIPPEDKIYNSRQSDYFHKGCMPIRKEFRYIRNKGSNHIRPNSTRSGKFRCSLKHCRIYSGNSRWSSKHCILTHRQNRCCRCNIASFRRNHNNRDRDHSFCIVRIFLLSLCNRLKRRLRRRIRRPNNRSRGFPYACILFPNSSDSFRP